MSKAYLNSLHEEDTREEVLAWCRKLESEMAKVPQKFLEKLTKKELFGYLCELDAESDKLNSE